MSSISLGEMFSPLRMMTSLARPGDDEVVAVDPAAEIAGAEVAFGVERVGLVLGVQIAEQHLRHRVHGSPRPGDAASWGASRTSAMPGRPSVSAAWSGSPGAPTVVTGTSVDPYTRVTAARSKYEVALRISDGGTDAPPQMNTFRSGSRVPARLGGDQ